jgi:hypothetical protein
MRSSLLGTPIAGGAAYVGCGMPGTPLPLWTENGPSPVPAALHGLLWRLAGRARWFVSEADGPTARAAVTCRHKPTSQAIGDDVKREHALVR